MLVDLDVELGSQDSVGVVRVVMLGDEGGRDWVMEQDSMAFAEVSDWVIHGAVDFVITLAKVEEVEVSVGAKARHLGDLLQFYDPHLAS